MCTEYRGSECESVHLSAKGMEEDNGDPDCRCPYEQERDKRVAKIKELMKPMEDAAANL